MAKEVETIVENYFLPPGESLFNQNPIKPKIQKVLQDFNTKPVTLQSGLVKVVNFVAQSPDIDLETPTDEILHLAISDAATTPRGNLIMEKYSPLNHLIADLRKYPWILHYLSIQLGTGFFIKIGDVNKPRKGALFKGNETFNAVDTYPYWIARKQSRLIQPGIPPEVVHQRVISPAQIQEILKSNNTSALNNWTWRVMVNTD